MTAALCYSAVADENDPATGMGSVKKLKEEPLYQSEGNSPGKVASEHDLD